MEVDNFQSSANVYNFISMQTKMVRLSVEQSELETINRLPSPIVLECSFSNSIFLSIV